MQRSILISDICRVLALQYIGEDIAINGLNLCNRISEYDRIITYVTNETYVETILHNEAVTVIILAEDTLNFYKYLCEKRKMGLIVCENPEEIFYDIHEYLYRKTDFYEKFSFSAKIDESSRIHQKAVIDDGVIIGKNVVIGANTVIHAGTVIEDNCMIGCNTIIGSEGFQVVRINGINRKITHCGGVLIRHDTFIGDNSTICNSLFEGHTYIGEGAMIDNLVHVGHNGYVGDNAVVTAGTILCGSSAVEDGAWIGVNSSVLNRVVVGKNSKVGIGSVVTRQVPDNTLAYGVPAKVKMIFAGGRRLGINVLSWLCTLSWIEVAAIVPIPRELDMEAADDMQRIIDRYQLQVCSMEEVKGKQFDIGLSVNYHKIIPAEILSVCKRGFYNIHHSYNMRLRGRNIATHAILNCRKEKKFYHGTSLHMMIPELDAGPIIASAACEISYMDTAFSLFQKTDRLALQLVKEWFPRIAQETVYPYYVPEAGVHYYKNKDLPSKEILVDVWDGEKIYDYVRAFDFPDKEPAYIFEDGMKKELVLEPRNIYTERIYIKGHTYYTNN